MQLLNLARYLAIVITDGDYLNDWLSHLPVEIQGSVQDVGYWIAGLLF